MTQDKFIEELKRQYAVLFLEPEYKMASQRYTPEELARKMTAGLKDGTANKDGDGIRRTCKALGIKFTYKAIQQYLKE